MDGGGMDSEQFYQHIICRASQLTIKCEPLAFKVNEYSYENTYSARVADKKWCAIVFEVFWINLLFLWVTNFAENEAQFGFSAAHLHSSIWFT